MNSKPIASTSMQEHVSDLPLLAAKLGLAGHQIHKRKDGYLVYRLNLAKYCSDYGELVAFSKKVGVLK